MIISIISAYSKNKVIGKDNDLPWNIPAEFKHFKKSTMGRCMLMGRKTFESLPGILPGRTHLVLSQTPNISQDKRVQWFDELNIAIKYARNKGEKELFIIGGAQIYELCLPLCDRLYLSEIDIHIEGDAYFPKFDEGNWEEAKTEIHAPDSEQSIPSWTFRLYERKVQS